VRLNLTIKPAGI